LPARTDPIHPCAALFKTQELQDVLSRASFASRTDDERGFIWDTGGDVYHRALVEGKMFLTPGWVRDAITHYGNISALTRTSTAAEARADIQGRYWFIQKRLEKLESSMPPSATFVIPCADNPDATRTCLENLRRGFPDHPVIMVNHGSDPDHQQAHSEMARRFHAIFLQMAETCDKSAAINAGMALVSTPGAVALDNGSTLLHGTVLTPMT
jgi:folylpolyglutamate synthase/dihydropteroate synthase